MKAGTLISSVAHAGLLGWGLIFLDVTPPDFKIQLDHAQIDVAEIDNQALAKGDADAQVTPKPAPKKTIAPVLDETAQNFGEGKTDAQTNTEKPDVVAPVVPSATTRVVEKEPAPVSDTQPSPREVVEDTPVPTNEVAALNEPPVPVIDNSVDAPPATSETGDQFAALPDVVPSPIARPTTPKPAKTVKRKITDNIEKKILESGATSDQVSSDDQIANLLNKQKPTGSGARRSNDDGSLGARDNTTGKKLSRAEMEGLVEVISGCSSGIAGREISKDLSIKVTMELAKDGSIVGNPLAEARGGTQAERQNYARDVLRYVKRCAPYDFLPKEKYDTWATVKPTFYPSQMFE